MKGIIDRLEGNKVVVEMENENKMKVFDIELFPDTLKEGDVVKFENGKFIVDEKETKNRKKHIENLFRKLIDKGME